MNYLILAHHAPDRFHALVDRLVDEQSSVFAHIDAKVDIRPFLRSDATFVAQSPVLWGGWSMVEATLKLVSAATYAGDNFDYSMLLSGDSFPLQSPDRISGYFARAHRAEFINLAPMPSTLIDKPLSRTTRYFIEYDRRDSRKHVLARAVNAAGIPHPGRARAFGGRIPYSGSQWWTLTRAATTWLEHAAQTDRLNRFMRHSHVPDEMFVHTLLGAWKDLVSIRRSVMYTDWSDPSQRPAEIALRHVAALSACGLRANDQAHFDGALLFARKVLDKRVADRIQSDLWTYPLEDYSTGISIQDLNARHGI